MEVVVGPLFTEIRQKYSTYATHVVRLTQNMDFVEVNCEFLASSLETARAWTGT
jgi:hypothetical protein